MIDLIIMIYIYKLEELCKIISWWNLEKYLIKEIKDEIFKYDVISNWTWLNAFQWYTNTYKIDEESITISSRWNIWYCEYRNYKYFPIIRLLCLTNKQKEILYLKYLYYFLTNSWFEYNNCWIPQLTIPMISKINIHFPKDISKQEDIVNKLDTMNNYIDKLNNEYNLVDKQIKYYTNKLMSF